MESGANQSFSADGSPPNVPTEAPSFARDENGQISILVVLCVIPFIFLLAFIFNSARQTSRKIEMQGAADAAAVASAVTMARGMNFMVLNNNAMAEVLSLMIAVRCIKNTTRIMEIYVPLKAVSVCAAAAACLLLCTPLDEECEDLTFNAVPAWFSAASRWTSIDNSINNESSGVGWKLLNLLDGLNGIVKRFFPFWSAYQAREYARKNGADLDPIFGFVLGGKSDSSLSLAGLSIPLPIPTFPVARGPEQAIAYRLEECQYKFFGILNGIVSLYVVSIDPRRSVESVGLYQLLRWANINELEGDWGIIGQLMSYIPGGITSFLGDITKTLGQFLGIELLEWRDNPPKPMLLTDHPADDTTDQRDVNQEARNNLRPYLQNLGFALGRVPIGSPIGGEQFINKPNSIFQMQFTYAQADVYNPTKWDMWTQDWRAQLSRSTLFDQKVNDILQILPTLDGGVDWSFVNTH
jgi:hypothetical protein